VLHPKTAGRFTIAVMMKHYLSKYSDYINIWMVVKVNYISYIILICLMQTKQIFKQTSQHQWHR